MSREISTSICLQNFFLHHLQNQQPGEVVMLWVEDDEAGEFE